MKNADHQKIFWQASLATLVAASAIALWSGPATAYATCARGGDWVAAGLSAVRHI